MSNAISSNIMCCKVGAIWSFSHQLRTSSADLQNRSAPRLLRLQPPTLRNSITKRKASLTALSLRRPSAH